MNIQELERITGITRQNIRFYEKKGLVHPPRNAANNYREYTQENVRTLQIIKALRSPVSLSVKSCAIWNCRQSTQRNYCVKSIRQSKKEVFLCRF